MILGFILTVFFKKRALFYDKCHFYKNFKVEYLPND